MLPPFPCFRSVIKLACPDCGQGDLYLIRWRTIDVESYLCDECDSVWLEYLSVTKGGAYAGDILRWIGKGAQDYSTEIEFVRIVPWP